MKGFRHKPEGTKHEPVNWTKYAVITACVLFAVFMVVSMLGMSWLNIFSQAKPGNTATVDFTIRDAQNRPVVTTSSSIFQQAQEAKNLVLMADKLPVRVNISETKDLVAIQVVNPTNQYGLIDFGLFKPELDAINEGVTGMKVGESKTITIQTAAQFSRTMSLAQFANITGEDFTNAAVGDQVPIAFTESPQIAVDNATPSTYLRTSTIVAKTGENVTINYGYPTIDISLYQLNTK
ncbi:MAG TPA: hypothetical protein VN372_02250 [Methanospirillum sp.]|nr:hypothetical protein [Methanospirillum sp.]